MRKNCLARALTNECDYFLRTSLFSHVCVHASRDTDNAVVTIFFCFLSLSLSLMQTYANSRVKFMLFYNWKETSVRFFFFRGRPLFFALVQVFQLNVIFEASCDRGIYDSTQ